MMIRNVAAAAAAFACLMSTAALADTREPVSVRVSYAGLNLSSVAGRAAFDARITRAVRQACRSVVSGLRGFSDVRRCRDEMHRDAQIRIAQIDRVRPIEVASTR